MAHSEQLKKILAQGREMAVQAVAGDMDLGPFAQLPGVWINEPGKPACGYNMISLPYAQPGGPLDYRLLLNRYKEKLEFDLVNKAVANRGIQRGDSIVESDQFVVTLDYMQGIAQEAAADFPDSGLAGPGGMGIHREPGLWLHMKNQVKDGVDIARLSTIPHGNSVLALGTSREYEGAPEIPEFNSMINGGPEDLNHPYMAPYKHFHDNPFEGVFDPVNPRTVLEQYNEGVEVVRTTELHVDTFTDSGGISSIPFIDSQTGTTRLQSWFWIIELAGKAASGAPAMRLQYLQLVNLDFFPRPDGTGLLGWPHVCMNSLVRA